MSERRDGHGTAAGASAGGTGRGPAGVNGRAPSPAAVRGAMAAMTALLAITVAWWVLALWPVAGVPPAWLERARQVCFNAGPSGLPDASGWMLLVGQPIGMLAVLMVVAGDAVREGLRRARERPAGRVALAAAAGVVVAGTTLAGLRVAGAPGDAEWLEAARAEVPATYPRLDRRLPAIELVDQHGEAFTWERIAGRPALLTFGFGHCETVCPMTVMNARRVQERFRAEGREVALVVITLDPWRDTPSRLPALARQFHLGGEGSLGPAEAGREDASSFLLSGTVDEVNAALDALQVARERVPRTGDIVHPALVYLLDAQGTVAYAASGHADLIEELARRM